MLRTQNLATFIRVLETPTVSSTLEKFDNKEEFKQDSCNQINNLVTVSCFVFSLLVTIAAMKNFFSFSVDLHKEKSVQRRWTMPGRQI